MLNQYIIDKINRSYVGKSREDIDIHSYVVYGALREGQLFYTFCSRDDKVKEIIYLGKTGEGKSTKLLFQPTDSSHSSTVFVHNKFLGDLRRTMKYYFPEDNFTFACKDRAERFLKRLKKTEAVEEIKKLEKYLEENN